MDVLRHAGRAQLSAFAGGAEQGDRRRRSGRSRRTPRRTCSSQIDQARRPLRRRGRALQQDADDYVAGINAVHLRGEARTRTRCRASTRRSASRWADWKRHRHDRHRRAGRRHLRQGRRRRDRQRRCCSRRRRRASARRRRAAPGATSAAWTTPRRRPRSQRHGASRTRRRAAAAGRRACPTAGSLVEPAQQRRQTLARPRALQGPARRPDRLGAREVQRAARVGAPSPSPAARSP